MARAQPLGRLGHLFEDLGAELALLRTRSEVA